MELRAFAVRDMKALAFLQPFFSNSSMSAIRAFGDAVAEEKSPFNKHPEDYVLYEIGGYDDNTGMLTAVAPVRMLGCATDFINPARPVAAAKVAVEPVVAVNGKE